MTETLKPTRRTAQSRTGKRALELLTPTGANRPEWIRAPKAGPEFHSGFSRAKLYELANAKKIRSVSVRDPGQIKGTRLFNLPSIMAFIERCEQDANLAGELKSEV